jgi:acyl carrier protein
MSVNRESILSLIQESKAVEDITKLRDDVKLSDQGIDSLEFFNVLLLISEKYGIDIPDEDSDHLHTINQIIEYLNRNLI